MQRKQKRYQLSNAVRGASERGSCAKALREQVRQL